MAPDRVPTLAVFLCPHSVEASFVGFYTVVASWRLAKELFHHKFIIAFCRFLSERRPRRRRVVVEKFKIRTGIFKLKITTGGFPGFK